MPKSPPPHPARERRAMLRLLHILIREIEIELYSSSPEEMANNPILRGKAQTVERALQQLRKWEDA